MNGLFSGAIGRGLHDVYFKDGNQSKGRRVALGSALLQAIYNAFITGVFYTGFLSMCGISITEAGIVTFIPFIANCFSIFSFSVLSHFKRIKPVLLAARFVYYFLYIVAATVIPLVIMDHQLRLMLFIIILFVAHALYALFSSGFTAWLYEFYPEKNTQRMQYITYNQIFASVVSSLSLLMGALIADAMAGSPDQGTLIICFRCFAFILVIAEVFLFSRASEPTQLKFEKVKLNQVFILPFRNKKYLFCMALMFAWNYTAYLNSGLWGYHLLNHLHFSYTLINTMSVMYTVILTFLSSIWRKVIRRYSWIKTFGICCLIWIPSEIFFFFLSSKTSFMYIPLCLWQHIINVGLNLSYSNVLYMNLPRKKEVAYLAFNTLGCNICAFLGLLTGTFISGITGDVPVKALGMDMYSVQFTTLMRAVMLFVIGYILVRHWRSFTRDEDIADVESMDKLHLKFWKM